MKVHFCIFLVLQITLVSATDPVFKNPGIPSEESFEIKDYIDNKIGFIVAKVNITLIEKNSTKYYHVTVNEGNIFLNEIEINYNDLTTLSEKRTDLRNNTVVELFKDLGNNKVLFTNKEKKINKVFKTVDKNIYSRYAYFFSLRGFPFAIGNVVSFKTYMFEYGDALNMRVTNISKTKVVVKTGTYDCYKLELSIAGWQSIFASDKYYLYFDVVSPHQFIKYEEKEDDGSWNANELIKINQ